MAGDFAGGEYHATAPATPAAQQWAGWGTALKPALEPITVARKPLTGTVAANVLEHGTGAINVDGCRVACTDKAQFPAGTISTTEAVFGGGAGRYADRARTGDSNPAGRWPANLIHDGSDEVVGLFPESKGMARGTLRRGATTGVSIGGKGRYGTAEPQDAEAGYGDSGSAARFFYCAKASKADRGEGNVHPTVKPTELMRYLCRLVTPPGGVVLDPFMGSGSTGKAAVLEGFCFIGMEKEAEYISIADKRISQV
jgi:site-specific DNA-methyltransferase (adenine-specific)